MFVPVLYVSLCISLTLRIPTHPLPQQRPISTRETRDVRDMASASSSQTMVSKLLSSMGIAPVVSHCDDAQPQVSHAATRGGGKSVVAPR